MNLQIRSHAIALGPMEKRHIERRLFIALRSFDRHIDETIVSIRDVNGPRGGNDLQGQAVVRFRRGMPIVVRDKAENVYVLVSQLAAAVRRAVKLRIRRRKARLMRSFRKRRRPLAASLPASVAQADERVEEQLAI
jgi:ribosome-associated translation inhibitor RaiA